MKKSYILLIIIAATLGFFIIYAGFASETQEPSRSLEEIHAGITMPTPDSPDESNVSKQYKEQVRELERTIAENPEDTTHLLRLARMLQDGHLPSKAAEYYTRLLELNPGDHQSWLDLANCYAASGEWQKAEDTTHSMLDEFPNDEEARYNLGAIFANTGKEKEAREVWKSLLQAENVEVGRIAGESLALLNGIPTSKDEQPK